MSFVESLESRRLLSAVTLAAAEAKLGVDASALVADAKTAKSSLVESVQTFKTDLRALHLKNGSLKSALQSAVGSARSTIQADVTHIINGGYKDGEKVVTDVLHIMLFDSGNAAKIAEYQAHLAVDVKALQTLETPLITKLSTDVDNAQTRIGNAVQAIVTANSSDQSLQTDWTSLSTAFQSAKTTLVPDLTNVLSDVEALSTAT